ncbi:GAF domain-containing protein [Pseudomonas sp. FSL R10-0399]|uniref:ATP-binding protein n=1 Tax=Pseudomonas sp. FSL R10-0399 TaxID=2662194 RepID=UPI001297828E|nr:ATP-binding protein [Pseudomonas sp. FSL R10-0399]MQT56865.1 GAF domain-containing protein [Pseudomonas sp. FSL R10-0399]
MTPLDTQTFETLLANCADEPIRFPGAIQPHGLLLTLSEPDLHIQQISANVENLFGLAPAALLDQPLATLTGPHASTIVEQAAQFAGQVDVPPLELTLQGIAYEGLLHRDNGLLILELELKPDQAELVGTMAKIRNLSRVLQSLQAAKTLPALYDICVKEIQALTGYDRVLIYRFQEEGHGQVIAEASSPSMELFKGMFFPASDIPEQARELYRTHWLRIIPNADYTPVELVPRLRPDTQQPLDLSGATLRSVSPIHCQYMKNMGVLSSMSISLMDGDRLWGLISCGHRTPLHVPHELRMACQTIGQVLSLQISALQTLEISRQREAKMDALVRLNSAMVQGPENVFDGLAQEHALLMDLTQASGVAILEDNVLHRYGQCPKPEQIRELYQWFKQNDAPVFSTHNLSALFAPAAAYKDIASGLLAMSLPKPVDNGVLWFRTEVKESIPWSGDPRKPLNLESSETGLRLSPRTSFELWKVEMDGISTKWSHGDLFAANDLRRSALENDLARQVRREQQAVRARDELVAVVSHDLRNPMTIISMLCGMMQKTFSSDGSHASRRITTAIDTMQQASSRMNILLEDLLDTSKIEAGRYTISAQSLDVTQIFEEALSLLMPLASEKQVELTFHAEPDLQIHADPERLFQVLSNLISNAIKFTPADGKIVVAAMSNGDDIVFSVRDSGKGIPAEQLPHIFDRYWTAKEGNASGTGLGLYISQGIIKAHGGQLLAESTPGEGSEFRFTVPKIS